MFSGEFTGFQMWYEALPPFIIIVGCITVTGVGMKYIDRLFLEGKVNWMQFRTAPYFIMHAVSGLQNTRPLWSTSFTCVRIFCRTKDITMDTIVIQWYVDKWPGIL